MTTEHKVYSDKEILELAAALNGEIKPRFAARVLKHRAALALRALLKQQDAQSNYFSARMRKANEEFQRLNDEINALKAAAAPKLPGRLTAAGFKDTGWYTGRLMK